MPGTRGKMPKSRQTKQTVNKGTDFRQDVSSKETSLLQSSCNMLELKYRLENYNTHFEGEYISVLTADAVVELFAKKPLWLTSELKTRAVTRLPPEEHRKYIQTLAISDPQPESGEPRAAPLTPPLGPP